MVLFEEQSRKGSTETGSAGCGMSSSCSKGQGYSKKRLRWDTASFIPLIRSTPVWQYHLQWEIREIRCLRRASSCGEPEFHRYHPCTNSHGGYTWNTTPWIHFCSDSTNLNMWNMKIRNFIWISTENVWLIFTKCMRYSEDEEYSAANSIWGYLA